MTIGKTQPTLLMERNNQQYLVVDITNDYKTTCSFMGHQVYKARKIRIDKKGRFE